jgi:hypothetical protein
MKNGLEILNLHCGDRLNEIPIVVLAVPVQNNGGILGDDFELNPAVSNAENTAVDALSAALREAHSSGAFDFDGVAVVRPSDFVIEDVKTGIPVKTFSTERCFNITRWADGVVAVNQSDNARSEGIAVQLGWSAGQFGVPTLYASEHKIERVGPWLQNLTDHGAIDYYHALGDEAIQAAVEVFVTNKIRRIAAQTKRRIESGVQISVECDVEMQPRR